MTPRRIINKAKSMATGAFVTPWQDHARAKIMMIGFWGNMAYGIQSFALNYAMAGEGFTQSIIYQILRMVIMGVLIAPLTFWLISQYPSRFLLALMQAVGILFFLVDPASGFFNAVGFAMTGTSYWVLYNYNIAMGQSRENYGNETALSSFIIIVSYSAGLFLGGVLLEHDLLSTATIGGSIVAIIVTQLLFKHVPKAAHMHDAKRLIGWDKPSTRLSILASLQNIVIDGCMPIWMRVIGLSPLTAGLNMALRPIIGTMLTPVAGLLIQRGGLKAPQLGAIALVTGWILLATTHTFPWLLVIAMTALSMGTNLISPAEISRWYKRRSAAGVIARELLMVAGRVPAFVMAIPVIFFAPLAYPFLGLAVTGLFVWGTRPKRKGLGQRIKEVVGLD